MDVTDYEKMLDTIELLQEINQALQELGQSQGIPHEDMISSLKERLKQIK